MLLLICRRVGPSADCLEVWGLRASSGGVGPDHTEPCGVLGCALSSNRASMTLPGRVTLCVRPCCLLWREAGASARASWPDAGSALPTFPKLTSLTSVSEVGPLLASHRKSLPGLPSLPLVPSSFPFVPLLCLCFIVGISGGFLIFASMGLRRGLWHQSR